MINTLWLTDVETSARMDRGILTDLFTEGVKDVQGGQFKVIPRAIGANMTVTVQKGTTEEAVAFIKGDDVADQGLYRVSMDATIPDVAIAGAPATGTRYDLVVLETVDKQAIGTGTTNVSRVRVITGQSDLTTADKTVIPLARITVAAGQASITTANITDLRSQSGKAGLAFKATDVQWFTSSSTWTKVDGAKAVEFIGIGGGESGRGGDASNQNGVPNGGSGGRGAERVRVLLPAAGLSATMPVVVGAGGAAAVGGTYNVNSNPTTTAAGNENPGGDTTFAGVVARGGRGSRAAFTGGLGGNPSGYTEMAPAPGGNSRGGGAGGGGGKQRFQTGYQGPAGLGGTNEEVSTTIPTNTATGGPGGNGGAIGAAGTPGGFPGGGGGGGGAHAAADVANAGAGAKGGDGLAVIITYT